MNFEQQLAETFLWGNSLTSYLTAALWFLVWFGALYLIKSIIQMRTRKLSEVKRVRQLIFVLLSTISPKLIFIASIFLALQPLDLPKILNQVLFITLIVVIINQVLIALQIIADFFIRTKLEDEPSSRNAFQTIMIVAKFFIAVLGFLFILQNVGINVTSLIAGLGIGGIAIALAAQNILGDLFSSFAILFDKPFVPGDFIVVGQNSGVVIKFGIKTTRIRALQGEEIVIPNTELTSARIQNFKKLQERRIEAKIGVLYSTSPKKLKKIPEIIKEIVESEKHTRFDRAHLAEFGDSALIYEIIYIVTESDYAVYMDAQQNINFGIIEAFAKEKIEFAFPTQTVHLQKA